MMFITLKYCHLYIILSGYFYASDIVPHLFFNNSHMFLELANLLQNSLCYSMIEICILQQCLILYIITINFF